MKAIFTKYLPQTDTKPSRIRASDSDGNSATVTACSADIPYDYSPHEWAVITLCRKMQWEGTLAQGGHSKGNVFVFVNPDELLEVK